MWALSVASTLKADLRKPQKIWNIKNVAETIEKNVSSSYWCILNNNVRNMENLTALSELNCVNSFLEMWLFISEVG